MDHYGVSIDKFQLGFVKNNADLQIQTCQGSVPDEDKRTLSFFLIPYDIKNNYIIAYLPH
jgi:hypothetical protein